MHVKRDVDWDVDPVTGDVECRVRPAKARAAAEGVSLAGEAVRPMRDERRRPAWRLQAVHDVVRLRTLTQ